MSRDLVAEPLRFGLCDRCRVRRPVALLRTAGSKCLCLRVDHCDLLLRTTPPKHSKPKALQGATT